MTRITREDNFPVIMPRRFPPISPEEMDELHEERMKHTHAEWLPSLLRRHGIRQY